VPDPAQLPHLLRLIDDESEPVRQAVAKALAEFGSSLAGELAQLAKLPDEAQMRMIYELLESLGDDFVTASEKVEVETEPRFEVGQLVKHRRYGYRGVIVSRDLTYGAEDDWYLANQTQPDRDQPWYHVLVHDSEQVTHAAQTSLQGDDSDQQVVHPMIDHFFSAFSDGQYIRNDEAWPPS
jgi:heat shock protein HspQ